jgi:hypothetical protein
MGTPGTQKVNRYGLEFKLKAVAMSNQPGVLVQDVAESLCIHPFMLSRWRKQSARLSIECRLIRSMFRRPAGSVIPLSKTLGFREHTNRVLFSSTSNAIGRAEVA